ncbi:hypothetical protein Pcinc_010375 [Petrolisthes cinctipes]|uniref:Protein MIX23 n=1 Tax=Petrolisthes cinctipes TaxID=88211 RepID=A0AAE1G5H8_PETCI|nr:hypothetical protein Pcinc_010375 [Petrolisthes cinctipes]
MAAPTQTASCQDIADTLKAMRSIDDKIIYELNLATPTQSFRGQVDPTSHCQGLYQQLNNIYEERGSLIGECLGQSQAKLQELKKLATLKSDDPIALRKLRSEQSRIRELQNESTIEEIIRARSLKVFEERCRQFYKPPR